MNIFPKTQLVNFLLILGFKTLCEEIVTSLTSLYDVSSPYWSVINEIIFIYGEADKIYDYLALQVVEIHKTCSAFDLKYKEVMSEVQKREDARRTYDHYDQKMQKLVKKREEKASKYELETHKDFEYFGRVNNIILIILESIEVQRGYRKIR